MLKNTKYLILTMVIAVSALSSCIHTDFDQPPVDGTDPNLNVTTTISELKAMYTGTHMQITDSLIIEGIVVADDKSGNFYKSLVIQDTTGGILIRLDQTNLYADYPVGRKVYIKLNGLWMGEYNGLIQLGGAATASSTNEVDPLPSSLIDKYVIKATVGHTVVPTLVTIDQLDNSYQNILIQINNVQFTVPDTSQTYADAILQQSVNLNIEDCNGNSVILRTSGFADFAGQNVPNGNGTILAIYSVFGTDRQLIIRDPSDLSMDNTSNRCDPYIEKDFEDGSITSGGWTIQQVAGPSITWTTNTQGSQYGAYYGQCSNYIPPNVACDTWLISPSMDLSAASNPVFTFENASNYSGADMEVYISENYDGTSLPSTATWSQITVNLSGGGWSWVNSGNIALLPLLGGFGNNVHIAFRYTGTGSDGKTWEIDNIIVDEQ